MFHGTSFFVTAFVFIRNIRVFICIIRIEYMKFLIGTKQAMTQIFDDAGHAIAGTVILAGPATVTQIKTKATDNCDAVQIGFGAKRAKTATKASRGHAAAAGSKDGQSYQFIRQFKVADPSAFNLGDTIDLSIFEEGEPIQISGVSKGKGFQGGMKRYNMSGGHKTHGASLSHRSLGSIGNRADPAKCFKNKKMPGQMGNVRVTIQNVRVVSIDHENQLMLIKGSVPGPKNGVVMVRKAVKVAG